MGPVTILQRKQYHDLEQSAKISYPACGECRMNLTVANLGKQYRRDLGGLKDFSLEIEPGILGLLGPNGAGKSTFMQN